MPHDAQVTPPYGHLTRLIENLISRLWSGQLFFLASWLQDFALMGGPWLPSVTAFINVFLMASLKVNTSPALLMIEWPDPGLHIRPCTSCQCAHDAWSTCCTARVLQQCHLHTSNEAPNSHGVQSHGKLCDFYLTVASFA